MYQPSSLLAVEIERNPTCWIYLRMTHEISWRPHVIAILVKPTELGVATATTWPHLFKVNERATIYRPFFDRKVLWLSSGYFPTKPSRLWSRTSRRLNWTDWNDLECHHWEHFVVASETSKTNTSPSIPFMSYGHRTIYIIYIKKSYQVITILTIMTALDHQDVVTLYWPRCAGLLLGRPTWEQEWFRTTRIVRRRFFADCDPVLRAAGNTCNLDRTAIVGRTRCMLSSCWKPNTDSLWFTMKNRNKYR